MALSPGTGELILRAAQGISNTLVVQRQMQQRQQQREQLHQEKMEALKLQNEQNELKLKIDKLRLEKETFETSPEQRSLQTRATEADIKLTTARTENLRATMQRGPQAEKDLAFLQKAAHDRGVAMKFTEQFASKQGEWGFGTQEITNEFGHKIPVDITQVFRAEGGASLMSRELLHRQLERVNSQRADYLERFGPLINQKSDVGANATSGLQQFDKRLAALRAALRAESSLTSEFSPRQLRDFGAAGNPNAKEANEFEDRRASVGDAYFQSAGITDNQGERLAESFRGVATAENKRPHSDAVLAHIRSTLGRTRAQVFDSPQYAPFVAYFQTYFKTADEAEKAITDILTQLP